MAVATKSQDKSSFVKAYLTEHPEGNVKAVNEAWTAAGMEGKIGDTLIYQTRADMGLSGKLRAKAKPKSAAKTETPTTKSEPAVAPGKSMFLNQFIDRLPLLFVQLCGHDNLNDTPEASASARLVAPYSFVSQDQLKIRQVPS